MPIYNSAQFLADAVESVLAQSDPSFELILINDGSTDNSYQEANLFAMSDQRIRLIDLPENKGVAFARNIGIDEAVGEFIFFMDSDDTIDEKLFESINESLKQQKSDVVLFGLTIVKQVNNETRSGILVPEPRYCSSPQAVRDSAIGLEQQTLLGYACNKVYNTNFLKKTGARFEEWNFIEDILFCLDVLEHTNTLTIIGEPFYHYHKRQNDSRTAKFTLSYFPEHELRIKRLFELHQEWDLLSANTASILANRYARYIFSALVRNCNPQANMKHSDRLEWIETLFDSPFFKKLRPFLSVDSSCTEGRLQKFLNKTLVRESKQLSLIYARVLYLSQTAFPLLFDRISQNRSINDQ